MWIYMELSSKKDKTFYKKEKKFQIVLEKQINLQLAPKPEHNKPIWDSMIFKISFLSTYN